MKKNIKTVMVLLLLSLLLAACGVADGPVIKDSTNTVKVSPTTAADTGAGSSDLVSSDHTQSSDELSNNLSENNNNYVEDKTINQDNENMENADNQSDLDNSEQEADKKGNQSALDNTQQKTEESDNGGNSVTDTNHSSFYKTEITADILARISGKSYPADTANCQVSLDELRYCHVLHYGFDGETHEGELIVNKSIADDILEIFEQLYEKKYPIERMVLVDEYGADDETSMRANNTSAFNYRTVSGSTTLSNHSYGLAIDINPLYNPYVVTKSDGSTEVQPATAVAYADRLQSNAYFIRKYDDCYNLFIEHGFTWGGDWNTKKDYQHFEHK